MLEKTKVISYIFRSEKRDEILVFDHVGMPEAGTQVVGGTVEQKEDFKAALVREIAEESGLNVSLNDLTKIGETIYFRQDYPEKNYRHYYSLMIPVLPDKWTHTVISNGADNGLIFLFYWLTISEAKTTLTGNFGELL
ncbi:MAG: NUDIX domain-containing protein [Bdellovibrionales bacterium]|nr:NUDIX domain-containing protein [Bdellovibrionales bacterium]